MPVGAFGSKSLSWAPSKPVDEGHAGLSHSMPGGNGAQIVDLKLGEREPNAGNIKRRRLQQDSVECKQGITVSPTLLERGLAQNTQSTDALVATQCAQETTSPSSINATQATDTPTRDYTPIPRRSTPSPQAILGTNEFSSPTTTEEYVCTPLCDKGAALRSDAEEEPKLLMLNDCEQFFERLVRGLIAAKKERGLEFTHAQVIVTVEPFCICDWFSSADGDVLRLVFCSASRFRGFGDRGAIMALL